MYPLSTKGINQMNELDCMRAIVLQGGRAGLTNKGINEMNELDCLREMVLRSSGGLVPVNTLAPAIEGVSSLGNEVSCTTGNWTNDPTSYTYQWFLNGSPIGGATASTWVVAGTVEDEFYCEVTAHNAAGASAPAQSNTDVIQDPLASITLDARIQTHNGDGVPLGLYQDVACTTPATQDFDPVAAIRGEFPNGVITFTQSDEAKQGYLLFRSGVPCVETDGVDDFYEATLSTPRVTPEVSILCAVQTYNATGVVFSDSANGYFFGSYGAGSGNVGCNDSGGGLLVSAPLALGAFGAVQIYFARGLGVNASRFAVDGSAQNFTITVYSGANLSTAYLARFNAPNHYQECSLIAVLIAPAANTTPERATINTYLQTLKP